MTLPGAEMISAPVAVPAPVPAPVSVAVPPAVAVPVAVAVTAVAAAIPAVPAVARTVVVVPAQVFAGRLALHDLYRDHRPLAALVHPPHPALDPVPTLH